MVQQDGSIQSTVKSVCSISYVSEKLQVSRPSLYKYMELYDAGDRTRVPGRVLDFFDFLRSGRRSEDDAILYFIKNRGGDRDDGRDDDAPPSFGVECITGGDGAMVMFPDCGDLSEVVVEVLADFDGTPRVIGEYRPEPGRRFVRIGDLVPDHTFYYRVRTSGDRYVVGDPVPFSVGSSR